MTRPTIPRSLNDCPRGADRGQSRALEGSSDASQAPPRRGPVMARPAVGQIVRRTTKRGITYGLRVSWRDPATGAAERVPVHLGGEWEGWGRTARRGRARADRQDDRSRRVDPAGAQDACCPATEGHNELGPTRSRSLPRVTTTVASAGWAARRVGSTCTGGWPSPSSISGRSLSMLLRQGMSTTWSMRSCESAMPSSKRPHRATRSSRTTSTRAPGAPTSAGAGGCPTASINKIVRAVRAVLAGRGAPWRC